MSTIKTQAPWKRKRPKGTKRTPLFSADKREAKAAAKEAGRPYPNLVDNMRVARKKKKRM
jgi:hypothetical protein